MKRWILYICLLALTVTAPAKPLEIADLLPIRAVGIYKEGEYFRIETDTGNYGLGDTPAAALANMKLSAPGIIYLDTAQYLILTEETKNAAASLAPELRPSVKLCVTEQPADLAALAEYLDVHGDLPKLKDWKTW